MNIEKLLKAWEKELGPLTFGEALRNLRECNELSLQKLGDELGVSKAAIQQYEEGKRIPSPEKTAEIAEALGYSEKCLIELSLRDKLKSQGFHYNVKLETA